MLAEIFREGVRTSDISSIKFWLNAAVPRLTASDIVTALETYSENKPQIVNNALYWLPGMLPKDDVKINEQLRRLKESVDSPEREPASVA